MNIVSPREQDNAELRRYLRAFVPASDGAEMMCSALMSDCPTVSRRVAVDERGIAGAVSFTLYDNKLHVFSLGSIVKGAGSLLMDNMERMAEVFKVPVTVAATVASQGFYKKRGYKKYGVQKGASIIRMKKT